MTRRRDEQSLWMRIGTVNSYQVIILSVLILFGLSARLVSFTEPPLDFHRARQFHSIVIAHWFYIQSHPSFSTWEREIAYTNFKSEPFLEPPILEALAWVGYSIVGGEALWIPRLLSLLFWVAGAIPLYLISRWITSEYGALPAVTIYLFLPFAIRASRSFQPEPLMIAALLTALWAMCRYAVARSGRWLFWTTVLTAFALFIKPSTVFFLYPVFFMFQVIHDGLPRALVRSELYLFGLFSILPIALYSAYGFLEASFLQGQEGGRFLPEMILTQSFWALWKYQISRVLGFPRFGFLLFLAAPFGMLLVRDKLARAALIGLWIGYFCHSFFFTYHTTTHDYYHLPLIPIIVLSIAPIADLILRNSRLRILGIFTLLVWSLISIRTGIQTLPIPNDQESIRVAQAVGEQVHHSTHTILLADAFALPLRYFGQLAGVIWPDTDTIAREETTLSVAERFEHLRQDSAAQYFIVTQFDEFEKQQDLRAFLTQNYTTLARTDKYLIFDLRQPASLAAP